MGKNRIIGFVVLGIIGLIISQFTGAKRDSSGEINKAGDIKVTETRIGDCFIDIPNVTEELIEIESVKAIPCNEPHSWQVFHKSNSSLDKYSVAGISEESSQICDYAIEALSTTLNDSQFNEYRTADINVSQPTSASWAMGDKAVNCYIGSDTQTYYSSVLN
jgi:hypothetical protein